MNLYRREIDGLRAVAVLPVLLFHAGLSSFQGGFVGVDVFFVISGYLITAIIVDDLERGRFSLGQFYERRARRILPALFAVLLACVPAAAIWLLPGDFVAFARSLVATLVFGSNILFWRESGYFDTAAEVKPLLHTWSLAVEEQYYVLFPLLMIVVWRLGRGRARPIALAVFAAIFVASLALAQWGSQAAPVAAFYLLPPRAWELLVGASLALLPATWLPALGAAGSGGRVSGGGRVGGRRWLTEAGALAGLAAIAWSIFALDAHSRFPGLAALPPVLGAALVIACAGPGTLAGRVLGWPPLVGLGLVSYSTYLWHQPLLAFARQRADLPLDKALVLVALAIVLGALSWRFIERPFRNRRAMPLRAVTTWGLATASLLGASGLAIVMANGFNARLDADQRALAAFRDYDHAAVYRSRECFLADDQAATAFAADCEPGSAPPQVGVDMAPVDRALALSGAGAGVGLGPGAADQLVLVWGDSHAAALSSGLRRTLPRLAQFTASGCGPIPAIDFRSVPHCQAINDAVLDRIAALAPAIVLIDANWYGPMMRNWVDRVEASVRAVRARSPGSRVVVIGTVPQWTPSLPEVMLRQRVTLADERIETPKLAEIRASDRLVRASAEAAGAAFWSPVSALCDERRCAAVAEVDGQRQPLAWDYGHLTEAGALKVARALVAWLGVD